MKIKRGATVLTVPKGAYEGTFKKMGFEPVEEEKKENNTPKLPSLTVKNGTGGGEYDAGTAVTITSNDPPENKQFKAWKITPEVEFVEDTTETDQTATFIMPENDVKASVVYENNR